MSREQLPPEVQINFQRRIDGALGKNRASQTVSQTSGGIPHNLPRTRARKFVGREEAMDTKEVTRDIRASLSDAC